MAAQRIVFRQLTLLGSIAEASSVSGRSAGVKTAFPPSRGYATTRETEPVPARPSIRSGRTGFLSRIRDRFVADSMPRIKPAARKDEEREENLGRGVGSLFDRELREPLPLGGGGEGLRWVAKRQKKGRAKGPDEHRTKTATYKISQRKLNDVARLVARRPIDEAIIQMEMSDKKTAGRIKSMLVLARDHAIAKGLRRERLLVDEAFTSKGSKIKRLDIKGRGRFGVKHHPSARMHVVLREGPTRDEVKRLEAVDVLRKRLRMAGAVGGVRDDVKVTNPRGYWCW